MGGHEILKFLFSLPYRCYKQNLFKICPVVLEKILMHNRQWRTKTDATHRNRSPEWLRWPKNLPLQNQPNLAQSILGWRVSNLFHKMPQPFPRGDNSKKQIKSSALSTKVTTKHPMKRHTLSQREITTAFNNPSCLIIALLKFVYS